jgi:hypothetical protein
MMAKKQRCSSSTHIASAIALNIEIKRGNSFVASRCTLRSIVEMASQGAKINVQTTPCDRREPANASSLYLAITPLAQ